MPSSKKYKAKRKAKGGKPNATLRHEAARQKKLHGTKTLTKMKTARKKLRTSLGLKVGDKRTGGHRGGKLSTKIKKGGKGGGGRIQSAKANFGAGGAKKHTNKSVAKKGKGYSGRKKKA